MIGYGGAAGGGKTMLAVGKAATQHRKSMIFRRHKEDVKDLWSKMRMLYGRAGRPNESSKEWRDLPGDRYVRLVGLQHAWDWQNYQGQEHDFWDFDEATQFPEIAIRTLMAWCRSPDPTQRCQLMLGFNPPTGTEGEWVIQFFAPWLEEGHPNPALPGELRWFARLDDRDVEVADGRPFAHAGETVRPLSRTFFPARLEDNPILDATNYRAQLQALPEPLRSQMLYGDFTIGLADDAWQVIPSAWVRSAQARWTPDRPTLEADGAVVPVPLSQVGCDVAQGGADTTVIARRYGHWFAEPEVHPGVSVPDAAANAAHIARTLLEGGVAEIDSDGIGASTYFLLAPGHKQRVRAYKGSARTTWTDRSRVLAFVNQRAAAWWALRDALDPSHGAVVALPPSRELRAELCSARYEKQASGIKLEDKDETKKRIGRSPDLADAYVMANWQGTAIDFERLGASIPLAVDPGGWRLPAPEERLQRLLGEIPGGTVRSSGGRMRG